MKFGSFGLVFLLSLLMIFVNVGCMDSDDDDDDDTTTDGDTTDDDDNDIDGDEDGDTDDDDDDDIDGDEDGDTDDDDDDDIDGDEDGDTDDDDDDIDGDEDGDTFDASLMAIFGTEDQDTVAGAVFDADGNSYYAGITKGGVDSFNSSIFWAKYTAAGQLAWVNDLGHSNNNDDGIRVIGDALEGNGPSRMIAQDSEGNIYITGRGKGYKASSFYASYAMRIDPADGSVVWGNAFKREWTSGSDLARTETSGNACTVAGNRMYIVGSTQGDAMVLVYSLNTADGSLVDRLAVDASPTVNDRAYAVVADETNNKLYVGGWEGTDNRPILYKFDISTDDITLDWYERLNTGDWDGGTQISDLDVDSEGNVYVSYWIAGAAKWYEITKLTSDGDVVWGRRYNATGEPGMVTGSVKNETMIIRVLGNHVLVGGRVGIQHVTWGDTSKGDSGMVIYDLNGNMLEDRYYFTGTDNTKITIDHIKAFGMANDQLMVAGTIWPNDSNFLGEWLTPDGIEEALTPVEVGTQELVDTDYTIAKVSDGFTTDDLADAELRAFGHDSFDANFIVRDQSSVFSASDAENRAPSSDDAYLVKMSGFMD